MGWATGFIQKLQAGETVECRPRGNSMQPRIQSGQLCVIAPLLLSALPEVGDIVLCKVKGQEYLHLVKAIQGDRYQIGNNRGGINGWVGLNGIYGRLVELRP
jgi:hypothetical protein